MKLDERVRRKTAGWVDEDWWRGAGLDYGVGYLG